MLVRRSHNSSIRIMLTKPRRRWGTYLSTDQGVISQICGRRRLGFPGIHSILVRCTPNVKWRARNAVSLWSHVSPRADLIRWHGTHRFGSTAYLAPSTDGLSPGKTGLAQEGFSCTCDACGFHVTRESLAVAKFVSDLVKDPKNLDDVNQFGDAVYFP